MRLFFSFIIPVYNRPEEIRELLESFLHLKTTDILYEIIVVEDGSSLTSKNIVRSFKDDLPVIYLEKENSGPGESRNFGMQRAKGNYFIILDSDVLLPPGYLQQVHKFLQSNSTDCFGGADAAHPDFTAVQKAINFAMTSFLTTGGIRGHKKSVEKFKPRSFNMGISKTAFEQSGGFSNLKVGEDLDLSIRLKNLGFQIDFIPKAFVYHKRRSTWKSFYKQVNNFGMGRPVLSKIYPESFNLMFWFPSLFLIGFMLSLILSLFQVYFGVVFYLIYFFFIFLASSLQYKSVKIGFYSIFATVIQFFAYGLGYLKSTYYIKLLKQSPREAFPDLFYK